MGAAAVAACPEHGMGDIQTLWQCVKKQYGVGNMNRYPLRTGSFFAGTSALLRDEEQATEYFVVL